MGIYVVLYGDQSWVDNPPIIGRPCPDRWYGFYDHTDIISVSGLSNSIDIVQRIESTSSLNIEDSDGGVRGIGGMSELVDISFTIPYYDMLQDGYSKYPQMFVGRKVEIFEITAGGTTKRLSTSVVDSVEVEEGELTFRLQGVLSKFNKPLSGVFSSRSLIPLPYEETPLGSKVFKTENPNIESVVVKSKDNQFLDITNPYIQIGEDLIFTGLNSSATVIGNNNKDTLIVRAPTLIGIKFNDDAVPELGRYRPFTRPSIGSFTVPLFTSHYSMEYKGEFFDTVINDNETVRYYVFESGEGASNIPSTGARLNHETVSGNLTISDHIILAESPIQGTYSFRRPTNPKGDPHWSQSFYSDGLPINSHKPVLAYRGIETEEYVTFEPESITPMEYPYGVGFYTVKVEDSSMIPIGTNLISLNSKSNPDFLNTSFTCSADMLMPSGSARVMEDSIGRNRGEFNLKGDLLLFMYRRYWYTFNRWWDLWRFTFNSEPSEVYPRNNIYLTYTRDERGNDAMEDPRFYSSISIKYNIPDIEANVLNNPRAYNRLNYSITRNSILPSLIGETFLGFSYYKNIVAEDDHSYEYVFATTGLNGSKPSVENTRAEYNWDLRGTLKEYRDTNYSIFTGIEFRKDTLPFTSGETKEYDLDYGANLRLLESKVIFNCEVSVENNDFYAYVQGYHNLSFDDFFILDTLIGNWHYVYKTITNENMFFTFTGSVFASYKFNVANKTVTEFYVSSADHCFIDGRTGMPVLKRGSKYIKLEWVDNTWVEKLTPLFDLSPHPINWRSGYTNLVEHFYIYTSKNDRKMLELKNPNLLNNPVRIIRNVLNYIDYPTDRIDSDSFLVAEYSRSNWVFDVSLDEPLPAKDLLNSLCEQAGLFLFESLEGKLKITGLEPVKTDITLDTNNVSGLPKEKFLGLDTLISSLSYKLKNSDSYEDFPVEPNPYLKDIKNVLALDLEFISDNETAKKLCEIKKSYHYKPSRLIELNTVGKLDIGTWVNVDGDLIKSENSVFLVIDSNYDILSGLTSVTLYEFDLISSIWLEVPEPHIEEGALTQFLEDPESEDVVNEKI